MDQFLVAFANEDDLCADLLKYTVTEDSRQYEAALATIEHLGCCSACRATFVVQKSVSSRGNVAVKKYFAKRQP